mgnify:CR=1 FL=1
MSEAKLYAVRNDEGKYWNFADRDGFFESDFASCSATDDERYTKNVVRDHGGHVVTFVEEPEKVVVSKTNALRQGWLVARYGRYNPDAVSDILARYKDEAWDMIEAYVNGYTVAKEKKYNVKVPHTDDSYFYKVDDEYCNAGDSYYLEGMTDKKWFTDAEIEHYGLGDCEKVWCDSDDE